MSTNLPPSLEQVPFFKGLEPEVLTRFRQRVSWLDHQPNELVVDHEDDTHDVFFVVTGSVRIVVRAPNGREVIFGDLQAGQFFGDMAAIDKQRRSASVTALHRSRLLRVSGPLFLEILAASPIASLRMMRLLTERIRTGNARLLEQSALNARHRLFAELLRMARERAGTGTLVISPPPLQHVLAGRIGVRREAVSREMAQMIREGWLSTSRAGLLILKPKAMQNEVASALES